MEVHNYPKSLSDLNTLVDDYVSYCGEQSVIQPNKKLVYDRVVQHIKTHKFCRAIYHNNEIIAGGVCGEMEGFPWSNKKGLVQLYFATRTSGLWAIQSLRLFHREMYKYAILHNLAYCMSSCFLNDKREAFNRILEKDGWSVHGGSMYINTDI